MSVQRRTTVTARGVSGTVELSPGAVYVGATAPKVVVQVQEEGQRDVEKTARVTIALSDLVALLAEYQAAR